MANCAPRLQFPHFKEQRMTNYLELPVGDRAPEAFPSLILHSNHLDVRPVMKLFEHAIALCSDMRAAAVR